MSLLTCPVCQGSMREMNREGILIDVCGQCRGVWLDRGELEKLAALMPAPFTDRRSIADRDDPHRRRRDWDDDDDDHRYRDRYDDDNRARQPRSKLSRFMDFFD